MKKIYSIYAVYVSSFGLLCLLLITILFYNIQSDRIKTLALDSISLVSEWNELENKTNDLLLDSYTHFGKENSPLIEQWESDYKSFGKKLESLMSNPIVRNQPEMLRRIEGAFRIWRFTEVRLNNANYYFNRIIQSGLGERVMVNGMIHTMYQMRMEGQLCVDEIVLLEETIYALKGLDDTSKDFDLLFSTIVYDMKTAGEKHLRRIRLLFIAIFSSIIIILVISILISSQLKAAQKNRKLYMTNRRNQLLKSLCENSGEEDIPVYTRRFLELDIKITPELPILIVMLQIDEFRSFSHLFSLKEQDERIIRLCEDFSRFLSEKKLISEYFQYTDDMFVFFINQDAAGKFEDNEIIQKEIEHWYSMAWESHEFTVSITVSDYCFEFADLDHDFGRLRRLSEYRYLTGTMSFITPGSWKPFPVEPFKYPREREKLFEEAFKSLDKENTLQLLSDMIHYAEPYGPESVKRLILRLTAAQSSVVELLEKSYHTSVFQGMTPMILGIQEKETLSEAKEMLTGIVTNVISACLDKKHDKHDQTVEKVRDIIERELQNFNLSADQIAEHFNLTSSYINRLFKQKMSLSIAGYINEARLEKSKELLYSSDMTVSQIAESSGFSSMGTFFRLFKKRYGQTPREMADSIQKD